MNEQNQHNTREKLWDLIKNVRFAMISHQTENLDIQSQPMTMLNNEHMDEDQNLYFLLSHTNDLVSAVNGGRSQIGLSFAKPSVDTYVSISAHAKISQDRQLIDRLWNPWAENWFEGKDDPTVRVLVAKAVSAEYWDVKDNKVTHLLKVLKGNLTGETQEPDTEHQKVNL